MRKPALLKQPPGARQQISESVSLPAPVGGWNARDSIAAMDPRFALKLLNWWPTPQDVRIRNGYTEHVTGIGNQVETLMAYNNVDGTQTLFGAAGTDFYDVTSSGAVGAAVQSGLSNSRWQSVNFFNSSGTSYLCAFNAVDKPRYWDGSSWTSVDSVSTPAITGVTSTVLDSPWVHKRRLWMIEKDTLSTWYLPVDAVGGGAIKFDLAGIFRRGGYIVAGGTWTIDAGEGMDDYWVAISSEGEVVVYQGTDPSSGSTWALKGVWRIGEPVGNRPFMKYAGDMLVILRDGVYPLSLALQSSQINPQTALTDRIREAMSEAAADYGTNFGWELALYPSGNMIILNVPTKEGQDQEQYVMNTISNAWGRFQGIEANCWAILGNEPYFGGDGIVGKFWGTDSDNSNDIVGDLKQAFSYFGDRSGVKKFKMVRPIFQATESPDLKLGLNVDYGDEEPVESLSFSVPSYGVWDTATWDNGLWGGGLTPLTNWQSVNEYGTSAALRMRVAAAGIDVRFQAADYVYERGGVI